jgi:transcriptional regulator with XRE-family HTH domain
MNKRKIVTDKYAFSYAFGMKGIGERVKALRLSMPKPNSQGVLAELAGVNTETVNRIEHDHNCEIESLKRIADVFKVTIGDLLPEDQWPSAQPASLQPEIGICNNHRELLKQLDIILDSNDRWVSAIESLIGAASLHGDALPDDQAKRKGAK